MFSFRVFAYMKCVVIIHKEFYLVIYAFDLDAACIAITVMAYTAFDVWLVDCKDCSTADFTPLVRQLVADV